MTFASLNIPVISRPAETGHHHHRMTSSNAQLLQLVTASGLSSAVAMTIFNRGLGSAACSESQWKGYLAEPGSARYREIGAELLAHAVHQFARIGVHRGLERGLD